MLRLLSFFKIVSSLSFLFVVVTNEKLTLFMGMILGLLVFNSTTIQVLYSIFALTAVAYLFVTGISKASSPISDFLSLISIGLMYVPIVSLAIISLNYAHTWEYLTLVLFCVLSIVAIVLTVVRLNK